jgi:hypothetical protein
MQVNQLQQARDLAATAEQRLQLAQDLNRNEVQQQKRADQHRAAANRLSTEKAAADSDAQRAQRAGDLQSAVELHARCEQLRQLAAIEDACMGQATQQACFSQCPSVLVFDGTRILECRCLHNQQSRSMRS